MAALAARGVDYYFRSFPKSKLPVYEVVVALDSPPA